MKYGNARARDLLARDARRGVHYAASEPVVPIREAFEVGDVVRLRNGEQAPIVGVTSRGYELSGYAGKYFPAEVLERTER